MALLELYKSQRIEPQASVEKLAGNDKIVAMRIMYMEKRIGQTLYKSAKSAVKIEPAGIVDVVDL